MLHIVFGIAAAAGILRLLKRVLPARMAARIPELPAGASSVDRRHFLFAVLTIIAALVLITVVDLGAFAASVNDVFKRLHGLD